MRIVEHRQSDRKKNKVHSVEDLKKIFNGEMTPAPPPSVEKANNEVARVETFYQLITRYKLNPAEELFKVLEEIRSDPLQRELRVKILTDLIPYQFPKLKSVMTEQVVDMAINVTVKRFENEELPNHEKGRIQAPVLSRDEKQSSIDIEKVPEE